MTEPIILEIDPSEGPVINVPESDAHYFLPLPAGKNKKKVVLFYGKHSWEVKFIKYKYFNRVYYRLSGTTQLFDDLNLADGDEIEIEHTSGNWYQVSIVY